MMNIFSEDSFCVLNSHLNLDFNDDFYAFDFKCPLLADNDANISNEEKRSPVVPPTVTYVTEPRAKKLKPINIGCLVDSKSDQLKHMNTVPLINYVKPDQIRPYNSFLCGEKSYISAFLEYLDERNKGSANLLISRLKRLMTSYPSFWNIRIIRPENNLVFSLSADWSKLKQAIGHGAYNQFKWLEKFRQYGEPNKHLHIISQPSRSSNLTIWHLA